MTRRKTHEEFVREIEEKFNGEYAVIGEYINNSTKILIRHNCTKCNNYEWETRPNDLLRNKKCPICAGNFKKTTKSFEKEVETKFGKEYEILSEYLNSQTKIKVKHNSKECNFHEWKTKPYSLLQGHGCPVCASRERKIGVNTIWDTDRWMIDLGVSEEDAKKYGSQSSEKITVKCPNCKKEKKVTIANIYNCKTIGCPCGDGKSYSEKFMINVLDQLNMKYDIEYKPNWSKNKRYDFHIPSIQSIIEVHGKQHYNGGFEHLGGKNLKGEQENDKNKRELALRNGIKHYIELDCSVSNLQWIQNSIINSELNSLFDLSNINWNKCAKFANKNRVKEVCDYWNNKEENETTTDLSKIFKVHKTTIIKYLKKGTELNWCNYNVETEKEKRYKKLRNHSIS